MEARDDAVSTSTARPLRVLVVSLAFPLPEKAMRVWSVEQVRALEGFGHELRSIALVSWFPALLRVIPRFRPWAGVTGRHVLGGSSIDYLPWLFHRTRRLQPLEFANPGPWARAGWISVKRRLTSVAKAFQPDVVYAIGLLPAGYVAMQLKRALGIPFVVSCHSISEVEACRSIARRERVVGDVFDAAACTIVVAKRMERCASELWPGANVKTLYNGVADVDEAARRQARPPELDGKRVVFSCGTMRPRKGFVALVRAFARAAKQDETAVLRIAGDGPELGAVRSAIEEEGVSDRVTLLGRQPHSRVIQEMVWADVFALISRNEPFATVYLEAMAASTAIVFGEDGGIGDVAQSGVHGVSVKAIDVAEGASAIGELLGDADHCRKMGEAGRRLYEERLTWDAFGESMTNVLESSCPDRAGRRP